MKSLQNYIEDYKEQYNRNGYNCQVSKTWQR